jgi:hypothetical protein
MATNAEPPAVELVWANILMSTLRHRKNGRAYRRKATAKGQYPKPSEENGLQGYLLEAYKEAYMCA